MAAEAEGIAWSADRLEAFLASSPAQEPPTETILDLAVREAVRKGLSDDTKISVGYWRANPPSLPEFCPIVYDELGTLRKQVGEVGDSPASVPTFDEVSKQAEEWMSGLPWMGIPATPRGTDYVATRDDVRRKLMKIATEVLKAKRVPASVGAVPQDEQERQLRQMFSDGVDTARSYGDNAFHLWGEQLDRQFQRAYERMKAGEGQCVQPRALTGESASRPPRAK